MALTQVASLNLGNAGGGAYDSVNKNIFVVSSDGNFYVVDVTDPTSPATIGTLAVTNAANYGILIYEAPYVYLMPAVSSFSTMSVIDVSTPTAPSLAGTNASAWRTGNAAKIGNYIHSGQDNSTFSNIYDVTNPAAIVQTLNNNYLTPTANPRYFNTHSGSVTDGTFLFVATAEGVSGVRVVDVSTPTSPSVSTTFAETGDRLFVDPTANRLYALSDSSNFNVWDISTPTAPTSVSSAALPEALNNSSRMFTVSGNYVIYKGTTNFNLVDISNTAAPVLSDTYSGHSNNRFNAVVDGYIVSVNSQTGESVSVLDATSFLLEKFNLVVFH